MLIDRYKATINFVLGDIGHPGGVMGGRKIYQGWIGYMGDILAPKIVIYNKNKDVCKKNELKSLKIDRFMDI